MSDFDPRRFRPRAFRLDDHPKAAPDFVVEEKPDAYRIEAELPLDPAEQAVEKAQKQGFLDGGVFSWSGLLLSALGGLVSFAFTLWLSNLIESLFARSAALGVIGLGLAALALLAALVLAGREIKSIFRQRHIALLHRELALAHETDDSDLARKKVRELSALYKHDPRADRRPRKTQGVARRNHRRARPDRHRRTPTHAEAGRRGAERNRRRRQTRVGGGGDQPARHCRCDFRRRPGLAAHPANCRNLWRAARHARRMAAGPRGWRPSRHHRRHGCGRQPAATGPRPRHSRENFRAAGRRRAQWPADGANWPVGHGGLPPHAVFRAKAAGTQPRSRLSWSAATKTKEAERLRLFEASIDALWGGVSKGEGIFGRDVAASRLH